MRHRLTRAVSIVLLAAAPLLAGERPRVEYLSSGKVMPADLPFSEAVRVGDVVFLSGQIGILPGTRELAPGGIAGEAKQTMENIRATLTGIGLGMGDLVKCTVMLDDMAEWGAFNEVYKTFFDGRYPARSAFGADGLAIGAKVEVECIAAARLAPPAATD